MTDSISKEPRSFGPETDFGPQNQGHGLVALARFYTACPAYRPYMKDFLNAALEAGNPFKPDASGATAFSVLQESGQTLKLSLN